MSPPDSSRPKDLRRPPPSTTCDLGVVIVPRELPSLVPRGLYPVLPEVQSPTLDLPPRAPTPLPDPFPVGSLPRLTETRLGPKRLSRSERGTPQRSSPGGWGVPGYSDVLYSATSVVSRRSLTVNSRGRTPVAPRVKCRSDGPLRHSHGSGTSGPPLVPTGGRGGGRNRFPVGSRDTARPSPSLSVTRRLFSSG